MLLKAWISCCTILVALGWILSLFGALVPLSYEVVLLGFAAGAVVYGVRAYHAGWRIRDLIPARLTSRRLLLPALFAISAAMLLLKGLLTPPCHDDGLAYRIPRMLNWIYDHRWHWISAQDPRLDILGTVSEWLGLPWLLVFKTDRLVFLPNWISHLFLPGLIFSVWRTLGVPPRLAWIAMWLVPTGFCFALQAVNTSNDSIAAFFVLAAVYFALRGHRTKSWSDFAFSILGMALATGVKITQLAFIPAWLVVMGLNWRILFSRPLAALPVLLLAALVSFCPNALEDWLHGRGWTGLGYVVPTPPLVNFVCVVYLIAMQNLVPPLFALSAHGFPLLQHLQHLATGDLLVRYFHMPIPIFFNEVAVQQAGLGIVVSLLLVLMFCLTKPKESAGKMTLRSLLRRRGAWFFVFVVVAFFQYLFFVNSDQPARLICTFYLVLTPLFFVRRRLRGPVAWLALRTTAATSMLLVLYLALCLTENPLFPVFRGLGLNERAMKEERIKATIDGSIPPGEKSVGIIRYWYQREAWLWQPYGRDRRVVELPLRPDPRKVREMGIHYVVLSQSALYRNHLDLGLWLPGQPWTVVGQVYTEPGTPADDAWYLLKLGPPAAKAGTR